MICWTIYWCCKYNLEDGFPSAHSGACIVDCLPWLIAQPSWTSQNLFSPQTYLLFKRIPVVQLLGLEELVLVNILFQLPVGSGSWHVWGYRLELGVYVRVFPVLGRNLGEPVCWSNPAGLRAMAWTGHTTDWCGSAVCGWLNVVVTLEIC